MVRIDARPGIAHEHENATGLGLLGADQQLSWPRLDRVHGFDRTHDGAHETACFRIAECVATGILRGRPCRSRLECRWCCCRPFVAPRRTSCSAPVKAPESFAEFG